MRSLIRPAIFVWLSASLACVDSPSLNERPDAAVKSDADDAGRSDSDAGRAASDAGLSERDAGSRDGGPGLSDGGCVGTKTTGQRQPLDMYIMLDRSASMNNATAAGGSQWMAVSDALKSFLTQPNMDGISVGLQYFGFALPLSCGAYVYEACTSDLDCGGCGTCVLDDTSSKSKMICDTGFTNSCDSTLYAKPEVEIAPVAVSGPAIRSSIDRQTPTTGTPTSAALQGALDHGRAWAKSHERDAVIAVLATDGEPSECVTDLSHINALAAQGVSGAPKILTFVIGVGSSLDSLNGIAAAGGTQRAFMVDTGSGDTAAQFLEALNKIRGQTIGCTYLIPDPPAGQTLDYTQVNIQFTSGGSAPVNFFQVADASACALKNDAWYYDNPNTPHQILLCPEACKRVEAAAIGGIDMVLGCETITGPQ